MSERAGAFSAAAPPTARLAPLREIIRRFELAPDKRLGQHFLLDPAILDRIAAAAGEVAGRPVLEVGPGPGGLSRALLARGARLVAVERDRRCIAALDTLEAAYGERLVLIEGDALTVDIGELGQRLGIHEPWMVVANLPYNIGTELVVRWLHRLEHVASMHVLLQKEVAARITAVPGSGAYGRLSLLAQTLCRVRRCFDLPPGAFQPPPKVVSSLVELVPLPAGERPRPVLLDALEAVGRAAFGQRRKMLRSSLKALTGEAETLLAAAGIDASRRAETLTLAEFRALAEAWLAVRRSRGTA